MPTRKLVGLFLLISNFNIDRLNAVFPAAYETSCFFPSCRHQQVAGWSGFRGLQADCCNYRKHDRSNRLHHRIQKQLHISCYIVSAEDDIWTLLLFCIPTVGLPLRSLHLLLCQVPKVIYFVGFFSLPTADTAQRKTLIQLPPYFGDWHTRESRFQTCIIAYKLLQGVSSKLYHLLA